MSCDNGWMNFIVSVRARRPAHIFLAKLASFIYPYSTAFGVMVGLFLVLLPAISKSWELIVIQNPVSEILYKEFSFFGKFSSYALFFLLILTAIVSGLSGKLSSSWDMKKEIFLPTAKQVFELGIYPDTAIGEFVFYSIICIYFLSFFVWIYLPVGWVVFLLRSGA
ncbi:hypothetical protein [Pseudomonas pohangensis]|uniref:hypothetical protein n=1 Tax=Pseudomonas pohangensis TaxID=364197 RepID=UPI000B8020BE|nr:hypothetical protein [Pseudomonas pohangensis]